MGNKNSTTSRSTKNISNHNQVYVNAINEYEITLEAMTKASNESEVGDIYVAGKRNVIDVNVQQKANVANYIAASSAIQSVLESNADIDTKFEALTGLYNDAIQNGGLLSDNSSATIDETNINNENFMEICTKMSNAIKTVSNAMAQNKSKIGRIITESDAEENVLNVNIQQEATTFASVSNELFQDYAQKNGLTFKDLNQTDTTQQNTSQQTGNIKGVADDVKDVATNISDNVSDTAQAGIHELGDTVRDAAEQPGIVISSIVKPIIYVIIGIIVFVFLIVAYKILVANNKPKYPVEYQPPERQKV